MINPFNKNQSVEIRVSIRLPWTEKEFRSVMNIGREQYEDVMTPLPRDWDSEFGRPLLAMEQRAKRDRLAHLISEQIAGTLLDGLTSCDPVRGYDREELKDSGRG